MTKSKPKDWSQISVASSVVFFFFLIRWVKSDQILTQIRSKSGHVTQALIFVDGFVCFKFFLYINKKVYLHEIIQMNGKVINDIKSDFSIIVNGKK